MRAVRGVLALALVSVIAAACGIGGIGSGPGSGQGSGSCGGMPGGACSEQLERIGARHPGARQIDLECGPVPCTRAAGAGTARITRADGSIVDEGWTYTGDAGPMPRPTCTGIGVDVCLSVAMSAINDVAPSKRVLTLDLQCRGAPCNDAGGEVVVTFGLADGTTETTSIGWSGGAP